MKSLIIKTTLFCSLMAGAYFMLVDKLSHGFVDMYYQKFTQSAGSLIIGLSRADQGIDPTIIEERLDGEGIGLPLVNFAANQYNFGEVYLQAIKQKLTPTSDRRIFIVSVSPGSFWSQKEFGDKGIRTMDENTAIGKTKDFTSKPNYSYILNCYDMGLYTVFIDDRSWENLSSHDNGWNEVSLKSGSSTISPALMYDWKQQNLAYYERRLHESELKSYRVNWFIKTLEYLKTEGSVYLIRMPVDKEVLDFENQLWKGFNTYMDSIAKKNNIPYFDYTRGTKEFATYDGSHLYSKTAGEFTELLAEDIIKHRSNF